MKDFRHVGRTAPDRPELARAVRTEPARTPPSVGRSHAAAGFLLTASGLVFVGIAVWLLVAPPVQLPADAREILPMVLIVMASFELLVGRVLIARSRVRKGTG